MTSDLAPRVSVHHAQAVAVSTAGNDLNTNVVVVPEAGVVTSVKYVPAAAQSGANTNSRTLSVVNKGSDGSGSTSVASLALVSGTDLAAAVAKTITLSGTAANLVVAAGDVLQFKSTHVGTGIADPGGLVEITLGRG